MVLIDSIIDSVFYNNILQIIVQGIADCDILLYGIRETDDFVVILPKGAGSRQWMHFFSIFQQWRIIYNIWQACIIVHGEKEKLYLSNFR